MRAWLHSHAESFALTFRHFFSQPIAMSLSIAVIAIGLLFPVAGYLALANIKAMAGGVSTDPQINVFLARNADAAIRADVERRLRAEPRIKRFVFVSKDDALKDLSARIANPDLLAGLAGNPLPDAFLVTTFESSEIAQARVGETIRGWPGIEAVDLDAVWSRRLRILVRTGEKVVLGLGIALGLAMLAIVFNTMRLQVLTRTEEITVSRLFGATSTQIRRPFLYFGALQGLCAGLLAWGAIAAFIAVLEPMVGEVIQAYGRSGQVTGLSIADGLSLIGFSMGVGLLGASLAVRES